MQEAVSRAKSYLFKAEPSNFEVLKQKETRSSIGICLCSHSSQSLEKKQAREGLYLTFILPRAKVQLKERKTPKKEIWKIKDEFVCLQKEKEENDDHEEFMQRLDEIDRELQKSSSSSRSKALAKSSQPKALMKKHSSRSSQGAIEDLFDSDDEWANEGLETKEDSKKKGGNAFNPRQDPSLDRWALTSVFGNKLEMKHSFGNKLGVK